MKNLTLVIILTFIGIIIFLNEIKAQQNAQYSQYMFNTISYNPAYTGSRGILSINGIVRRQWLNISGSPTSGTFGIHSRLRDSNSAIGLWAEIDEIGFHQQFRLFGTYAYHLPLNNGTNLSLGLQAGVRRYNFDPARFNSTTESFFDPIALTNKNYVPNAGFGLYWYGKLFFVGLSAPHLLGESFDSDSVTGINELENHYYASAGIVLPVKEGLKFRPTVLLKLVKDAPVVLDLTAHFLIKEMVWLGISYRSNSDALAFMTEIQASQQIRLGYAYDLTISDLQEHNPHTHEVMLGYDFSFKNCGVITPRYF